MNLSEDRRWETEANPRLECLELGKSILNLWYRSFKLSMGYPNLQWVEGTSDKHRIFHGFPWLVEVFEVTIARIFEAEGCEATLRPESCRGNLAVEVRGFLALQKPF